MASQFDRRVPEITRNLLKLYRKRSVVDDTLGRAWYPNAHQIVVDWADTYGYSIATVACVIAAISPQCDWTRNMIIADDLLAGRPPSIGGAINVNVRKAERIRDDRAVSTLEYFPQGPKVCAFACNLAGDYSIVTIDTHALQAGLDDVESNYRLKWQPYSAFALAYVAAATKVSVEPAVFQSIIWHIWKRLYPRVSKLLIRRQWHVCGELED